MCDFLFLECIRKIVTQHNELRVRAIMCTGIPNSHQYEAVSILLDNNETMVDGFNLFTWLRGLSHYSLRKFQRKFPKFLMLKTSTVFDLET